MCLRTPAMVPCMCFEQLDSAFNNLHTVQRQQLRKRCHLFEAAIWALKMGMCMCMCMGNGVPSSLLYCSDECKSAAGYSGRATQVTPAAFSDPGMTNSNMQVGQCIS